MTFKIILKCLAVQILIVACRYSVNYPEGGVPYAKVISSSDSNFYEYPLIDELSTADSFRVALYAPYFYKAFDEPNYSLEPLGQDQFRLIYEGPFEPPIVVVLTEGYLIVKKGINGSIYPSFDETRLNRKEQSHYNILRRQFPINEKEHSQVVQKFLDSITQVSPELLDPKYYRSLIEKISIQPDEPFKYQTDSFLISDEVYHRLVDMINRSGYWSLPYDLSCEILSTDMPGFLLEANTKRKFKIVHSGVCNTDTSKFTKACQELINQARLGNKIRLFMSNEVDTLKN